MFVCEARFDEAAADKAAMMDDETREMLKQLLTVVVATRTDVQALAARMDGHDARFAKLEQELADVKSEVKFQAGVINARLDEQGRILAAMIPTRLAAVPAAE